MSKKKKTGIPIPMDAESKDSGRDRIIRLLCFNLTASFLVPIASAGFYFIANDGEVAWSAATTDIFLMVNAFAFSAYSYIKDTTVLPDEKRKKHETFHLIGILVSLVVYFWLFSDNKGFFDRRQTLCWVFCGVATLFYLYELVFYLILENRSYMSSQQQGK